MESSADFDVQLSALFGDVVLRRMQFVFHLVAHAVVHGGGRRGGADLMRAFGSIDVTRSGTSSSSQRIRSKV